SSVSKGNIITTLTITAPISGTISTVSAQIGSPVDQSTPIAEIVNNSQLHLDLFVYEKDLPKLHKNQVIHFTLTNNPGKEYDAKASYYNNSLLVEGYADTLEHEVKLYSVSRSNIESAPITIKIKPLLAPIWQVYRSIQVVNAFGGYNVNAFNPTKANISLLITKLNAFNEYEADRNNSIYTNVDSIQSKVRGLDTLQYRFGLVVMDRWGNKTDTLYKIVKPLFEKEFSKSAFSDFTLPGDAPQWGAVNRCWDGRTGWPYASFTQQVAGGTGPHMITFSIGTLGKISRILIRPYAEPGPLYYYLQSMRRFEIYGSAAPNLNGTLDASWTLLGSYTLNKPSGSLYGQETAADRVAAEAGFSWDADINAPKIKYIRIRCLENFAGGTGQNVDELAVYGDPR
ncbi:MAG: DUF5126 domain-containing protein, partial [Sphingobacteriaceae bacterium]